MGYGPDQHPEHPLLDPTAEDEPTVLPLVIDSDVELDEETRWMIEENIGDFMAKDKFAIGHPDGTVDVADLVDMLGRNERQRQESQDEAGA